MAENNNDPTRKRVIHAVLEEQAAKNGDKTFLHFREQEYTFGDLNRAADRVAAGLKKIGIRKGDKGVDHARQLPGIPVRLVRNI